MKENSRNFIAILLVFVLAAGVIPAAPLGGIEAQAAAYESKYPMRIIDNVVWDDLEAYTPGTATTKLFKQGYTHFPNGNNQNDFAIITETEDGNVIQVENTTGYPTFSTPGLINISGNIWVDIDLKIPGGDADFRLQYGNVGGADRAQLRFAGGNIQAITQDPAGSKSTVTFEGAEITDEWFTVSMFIDTVNQRQRIYINGEQLGYEMNLNHKYDYVKAETEPQEAHISKIAYSMRSGEGVVQLDNLRIAYHREILPIEEVSITIDKGESYSLPHTLDVKMDDDTYRTLEAEWVCVGETELDTNTVGAYFYEAKIPFYEGVVSYIIYVKERTISEIPVNYAFAYKNSTYTFPDTIEAIMSDGETKEVPVLWEVPSPDVSEVGTKEYKGTVENFGEVTLILSVIAPSVKKADDVYDGVPFGEEYNLPTRVEVTFDDFTRGWVDVTWDGDNTRVDVNKLGKYTYSGVIDGYSKPIQLTVTVYKDDPDLQHYLDCVQEFYDNCLTTGRDRSQWFPAEYAAGYDPATPEKISDNPHSPLFSMGISRETGMHALWPAPTGDYPIEATATYGPLMKGLIGMTNLLRQNSYEDNEEMTAEEQEAEAEKYLEAVEESYKYILDNFVAPESQILAWGDHLSRRFDTAQFDLFESPDNNSYRTHQLESDYPEWDVMFRMNPEATERYIKALWGAHFSYAGKVGGNLDKLYFSRHTSVDNVYPIEDIDNVFTYRPEEDPTTHVHDKSSQLSYIIAATDFAQAAIALYKNKGDGDALWWGRKLIEMYHAAAHPETGLVPFQFTSTTGGNYNIGDVNYPNFDTHMPVGRAEHAFPDYVDNPWCMDSGLLSQGKGGGGQHEMPLICFELADQIGGEFGKELEEWGLSSLRGLANYSYNYRTGLGIDGFTDGTDLTDVKIKYATYYAAAGRTTWPKEITTSYTWLMLDGYLRSNDPKLWECLRSIYMSYGLGDIGTAPGENIEIFECITTTDPNLLISVSKLYEMTGNEQYYQLAKTIAENIIEENFVNGYFYPSSKGKYCRFSDPQPYAILYFVAASKGKSEMIPKYLGISQDFQLVFQYSDGRTAVLYAKSLLNSSLDGSGGVTEISTNVKEVQLKMGEKFEIIAEASPASADDLTITWYSDNKKCCIVENNGVITALSPGKAVITAEAASGVYAEITVYVE